MKMDSIVNVMKQASEEILLCDKALLFMLVLLSSALNYFHVATVMSFM